jgi:integrase
MSKRSNGEGSITYDENKQLWRAFITTPAGKRLSKASKNEDIVKDWLNEQRLLIGRDQHVEPNTLTLTNWLTIWLETYKRPPKIRQRTYERYQSLIPHTETIGHIPIQKVTPVHLQTLYNFLQDEGLSGETQKKVHNIIHNAFDRAVINRYVQINPANLVDPPKVIRSEIEIFNKTELDSLLEFATASRLYPALLLAITTGMRLGEVLGVRWRDIDLHAKVVNVRQNLQMTNTGIIFEPPKTEKGKRKIPLPAKTVTALQEHRKSWLESRLQYPVTDEFKKKYPNNDDLVFVTGNHMPLHPKNFTMRFWNRIQEYAEFKLNKMEVPNPRSTKIKLTTMLKNCRQQKNWKQFNRKNFHALRHTYATTLLASGAPIVDVSRVLGHAKVSTTLDIYGHAIPENLNALADKIADALLI